MELNRSNSLTFLTEVDNSNWIQKRSKLEKGLIIFIILGVFGILGFCINIVRMEVEKEKPCSTSSCVLVAAQLLSQIDINVDPCNDFYLHACGKIVNATPKEHHPTRLLENKIEKQITILMQEPIDKNDHPVVNYQKELYQACIADSEGNQSFESIKKMFHDLNDWPVVVGENWNEHVFDWIEWVPKFHKKGLNYVQILPYFVEFDSLDKTKKIVVMYAPFVQVTERDHEIYKRTLIDTAIIFGAKEDDAHREMTQVIQFMSTIDKLKLENLPDSYELESRALVTEFQHLYKEINWLKYFNALLEPNHQIQPDDYLAFANTNFSKAFLDLVQKTPKRVIANYMFWCAANDLLSVLNDDILSIYNDQSCIWSSRKSHSEICHDVIKQNFSPLPSFLLYAKKYFTKQSREHLNDIFQRIKHEFQALLKQVTWMSPENKQKVETNFNTLNEIIGFKNHTTDYSVYNNLLKNKLSPKDGFLQMYLNFKSTMDAMYTVKLSDNDWILEFTSLSFLFQVETTYLRNKNTITLPVGRLQDWYYDESKPMYVKYATLGKNIASVLVNMMTGVHHTSDEEELDWTKETEKGFKEKTSCIKQKDIDDPMAQIYSYKKLEVGQISGLKIAYNAYKTWVSENGDELPPVGKHYTSSQLFWIASLTDSCFKDDYGFTLFLHNEPFKQNGNFAEDFDCYVGTKMNPSQKCNVL